MWSRTASGSATTSWPATIARPPVGRSTVLRIRRVVVLPAPLGPSNPKISPGWQSKLTSATAETRPRHSRGTTWRDAQHGSRERPQHVKAWSPIKVDGICRASLESFIIASVTHAVTTVVLGMAFYSMR